jgi:hypothetical protein
LRRYDHGTLYGLITRVASHLITHRSAEPGEFPADRGRCAHARGWPALSTSGYSPAMTQDRTFDWIPRFDPRTLQYPLEEAITTDLPWTYRYWRAAPTMDQGREGACVGHGVIGAVQSAPIDADMRDAQTAAFGLYHIAQFYDEWQGQGYEGTSVVAGLTIAKMLGMVGEFRRPTSVSEFADGIATIGPGVIGVNWRSGMMEPDANGWIHVTGNIEGGHCVYVSGVNKVARKFKIEQSWGEDHGIRGAVWCSWDDMDLSLSDDGEAYVLLAAPLP